MMQPVISAARSHSQHVTYGSLVSDPMLLSMTLYFPSFLQLPL